MLDSKVFLDGTMKSGNESFGFNIELCGHKYGATSCNRDNIIRAGNMKASPTFRNVVEEGSKNQE